MKTFSWIALLLALSPAPLVYPETPVKCAIALESTNRAVLSWDAVAGKSYFLKTTTNLAQPWQTLPTQPVRLTAITNRLSYVVTTEPGARFFRVIKLDTEAPELTRSSPGEGGVAVGRQAGLQAWLQDETGIAPNSIALSIGMNPPVTLADSRLTFTNGVLTYIPATNEFLGNYGQTVTVHLAAADTLGNSNTNLAWSFQLELAVVPSKNIIFVGAGSGLSAHAVSASGLTLISRTGDLFMYRYGGTRSGITNGFHLVDSRLVGGYTRTVLSFVDDPVSKTVAVLTRPARLAELLEEGSLSTTAEFVELVAGPQAHWSAGGAFHFGHRAELGRVLYQDANLLLEILPESYFDFQADASVSANFRWFKLTEFEASAGASGDLRLVAHAKGHIDRQWEGEKRVYESPPVIWGTMIGPIPVWVEGRLTFDVGYAANFSVRGEITNGITAKQGVFLGYRYTPETEPKWNPIPSPQENRFDLIGPTWQVEGSVDLKVYVRPRIALYVESLAGVEAQVEPYLRFTGSAQLNPVAWQWNLTGGVPGSLGLDLRVWDDDWGEPPHWEFDLVPDKEIDSDNSQSYKPVITFPPQNQTVDPGNTARFSVLVSGARPLSCQWQRNGSNLSDDSRISGSRSQALIIQNVTGADAGEYRVIVSNWAGVAESPAVTLTLRGSTPGVIPGMVWIPAGTFQMGDAFNEGWSDERPVHWVYVSAFYMDTTEVTKASWDEVYQWALSHGYSFDDAGFGKAENHPAQSMMWCDAVKWCNARSEKEGRTPAYYTSAARTTVYRTGQINVQNDWVKWTAGYRLPTEAEWEKAARGGLTGKRFPWGNTISHSQANYYSFWEGGNPYFSYDISPKPGYHPSHDNDPSPYTSPVGSFAPNGYGLYDMAGNLWEWCWDWYGSYSSGSQSDPRGPASGSYRVLRGGSWRHDAGRCRVPFRHYSWPDFRYFNLGFRSALPSGQ